MGDAAPSPPHAVLVVDKALGPTSHDVVALARKVLRTREVGHTGSLDPMATGVLVLVVGEATKLVNMLGATRKTYEATLALGASTTTLDAQGILDGEAPVPPLALEQVQAVAQRFVGDIDQRVPAVSAVKVDGQALHKLARKGRDVVAPVKQVTVHELAIRAVRANEIDLRVECSRGFYVRSLGRDLAEALGTLGHLNALRRTLNGAFDVAQAVNFEQLRAAARANDDDKAAICAHLMPFAAVCRSLPHIELRDEGVTRARHGRAIELEHVAFGLDACGDEPVIALDPAQTPVAIVRRSRDALSIVRGFRRV